MRRSLFLLAFGLWSCYLVLASSAQTATPATEPKPTATTPPKSDPQPAANAGVKSPAPNAQPTKELTLDIGQQSVLSRFDRFEKEILQMAEQLRRADPERADLLFRTHSRSQQERVMSQMRAIQELMARKDPQFGDSIQRQEELVKSLKVLLDLMQTENRLSEIEAERARIQELLKDVNRLVGKERDVRAATERGEDGNRSAQKQQDAADDTHKVVQKIDQQDQKKAGGDKQSKSGKSDPDGSEKPPSGEKPSGDPKQEPGKSPKPNDNPKPGDNQKPSDTQKPGEDPKGKPSDSSKSPDGKSPPKEQPSGKPQEGQPQQSSPPGEPSESEPQQDQQTPGRENLEQARDAMQRAIDELKKENREKASREQDEAIRRLLEAKEKLEEILRQLREEEKSLTLAGLEARFRKMLSAQLLIYQETVKLSAAADSDSTKLARSRQLATQEQEVVNELEKARGLLREEGSSVAFPEAVEAIREDMHSVVKRLDDGRVDAVTQSTEQAVIEALEEMLAAIKREMDNQKQKQNQSQQQQQQSGEQQDDPLVDAISELKMLKSLQLRINRRTKELGKLAAGGDAANQADIGEQLQMLSRRQARLQQATYDLATGKNK